MVIITFGEMITLLVSQTLAAHLSTEDMRGRYLAIFGLSWTLAAAIGPWAAGIIMDNYNPNLIWYAAGIISGRCCRWLFNLTPRDEKERFAALEQAADL